MAFGIARIVAKFFLEKICAIPEKIDGERAVTTGSRDRFLKEHHLLGSDLSVIGEETDRTKALQAFNAQILKEFKVEMERRSIPSVEIDEHQLNLDFYLNHYLLYAKPHTAEEGVSCDLVRDFLGNFFVHKAMWTDVDEQKASIESLLIFYSWLKESGKVSKEQFDELETLIENERESWFAAMERNAEESLESWQSDGEVEFIDELPIGDADEDTVQDDHDFIKELDSLVIPGDENDDDLSGDLDGLPDLSELNERTEKQ